MTLAGFLTAMVWSGDIFGDYGSASYDCAFAYGDVWHDDGFGSDPGFLFDADGFALDDPGVFEVVVDGEAMVDEAAFSYFHLAGEVELEGRQDGGGGGEYSLRSHRGSGARWDRREGRSLLSSRGSWSSLLHSMRSLYSLHRFAYRWLRRF